MSEESEKSVTAFGVRLIESDATRFMEAKSKAGSSCPVCGMLTRVALLTGPEDETASVIGTATSVPMDDGIHRFEVLAGARLMPVFHLWCANCGHLQTHTLGTLATWVKENPANVNEKVPDERAD